MRIYTESSASRTSRNRTRRLEFETMESRRLLAGLPGTMADEMTVVNVAEGESVAMPDFQLVDLNPASSRYNQTISPRDYLKEVSAWYFSHST